MRPGPRCPAGGGKPTRSPDDSPEPPAPGPALPQPQPAPNSLDDVGPGRCGHRSPERLRLRALPAVPIPPQPEAVTYGSYLALPVPQEPQGPAPAFAHAPEAQGDVQLGVQPAPRAPVQPPAWRGDPATFVGPPRPGARKLTIRLQRQRFEYSEGGRVVHSGGITSGSPEHPTPRGAYAFSARNWTSARAATPTTSTGRPPCPMPFSSMAPTMSARGGSRETAESHGCVRLHYEDARFVYERMRVGDRVAVVD